MLEASKPHRTMFKGIEGTTEPWENNYSLIKFISYFAFIFFLPLAPLE
jgi:hypothetical protein